MLRSLALMIIIVLFIASWYGSLFFHSFFNHRYAAHRMFTMSPFWEKAFFVLTWLTNGSAYLSPYAYGIMHRQHHAFADQEGDPHSPKFSKNIFDMMMDTRVKYLAISRGKVEVDPKFTKQLPEWHAFDKIAEHILVRAAWAILYIVLFALLATAWWQWLFLPFIIVMSPFHGAIINWFAHKIGYINHKMKDTSRNLWPWDLLMWGEGLHNNHHKHGSRANFANKWWELDPMYPIIWVMDKVRIIRLRRQTEKKVIDTRPTDAKLPVDIRLNLKEVGRLKLAFAKAYPSRDINQNFLEDKIRKSLSNWEEFVKKDRLPDMPEFLKKIQIRKDIQIFLENVDESLGKQLSKIVEPLDRAVRSKVRSIDLPKIKGLGPKKYKEVAVLLKLES